MRGLRQSFMGDCPRAGAAALVSERPSPLVDAMLCSVRSWQSSSSGLASFTTNPSRASLLLSRGGVAGQLVSSLDDIAAPSGFWSVEESTEHPLTFPSSVLATLQFFLGESSAESATLEE